MNIQDIVTELKAHNSKLPHEALNAAIVNREQITPELLQLIEQAGKDLDYLWDNPNYLGHIYAMYLLASFRSTKALPVIVEFLLAFNDISDEDFVNFPGDIASNLGRILASVCGGNDSQIKSLIEDEQVNQYIRAEAITALVSLVTCSAKPREEVLAYFQTLFRKKIRRKLSNEQIWYNLVKLSTALYPEKLYGDIKRVYAAQLVKPQMISLEHVENQLALSKERVLQRLPRRYSLIDNAIAEIEHGIYSLRDEYDEQISNALFELTIDLGEFPREALTTAIKLREKITPRLLKIFEGQEEHAYEMRKQKHLMMHIYALYLLAQFREERAYPLIVSFFSLPGDISVEITDAVVPTDLHRILASVYDGNDAPLKSLIEDTNVNEHVRNAGLKVFVVLVAVKKKSRAEVMDYFKSLFRDKLEKQPSLIWDGLVICSLDLYPEEVYEDIQQVYANNWISGDVVGFDEVQETNALGKDKVLERLQNNTRYTFIEDTVKEMQGWSRFAPSKKLKEPQQQTSNPGAKKGQKIGRNEPCPCGSGKKYKKCCGG
jgi:hypothetical protein